MMQFEETVKTISLQEKDQRNEELAGKAHEFTVGNDQVLDMLLAPYEVIGTLAHIQMLQKQGYLHHSEFLKLRQELLQIYRMIGSGEFQIRESAEDIHTEIELRLTESLGDVAKMIHTGRSRNDQALLDLKLFTRAEIKGVAKKVKRLFRTLLDMAGRHEDDLMPGYTHQQAGMVSSFGLWFSAYAESLADDLLLMHSAYLIANKNPLGSGAGYGGPSDIDRRFTTELLGFETLNFNSLYAQMNRGRMERSVAVAIASIASTLSRFATDVVLYMGQNYDFLSLPDELTTGSSIMPHKKNPDVVEMIRAKCNRLQTLPAQFNTIFNNLPSGYHRDLQLIKEDYMLSFSEISSCLEMCRIVVENLEVRENIVADGMYDHIFSVDRVNELVREGMPFRDAYAVVAQDIVEGSYQRPEKIRHRHEGSIGNLCLSEIDQLMKQVLYRFKFEQYETRIDSLLK